MSSRKALPAYSDSAQPATTRSNDWLTWWLPLLLVVFIAFGLRLVNLDRDLPANEDYDEGNYYLWAKAMRSTGRPDVNSGTGYPPGYLYMLMAEQPIVEAVRGPELNKSIDYFLFARYVNVVFGVACVVLIGFLGQRVTGSKLVGLACAFMAATLKIMVDESRRGAPNVAWVFFTLLAFIFLFLARDRKQIGWMHASVGAGVISLLFKYQSGVFLLLPFIYSFIYLRNNRRLFMHMAIWAGSLLLVLLWLVFVWKMFEIVHTPYSQTGSIVENGRFVGLQTLFANWPWVASVTEGQVYLWASLGTALVALAMAIKLIPAKWIDASALAAFSIYNIIFYFALALFEITFQAKWLTFIALVIIMTITGLFLVGKVIEAALPRLAIPARGAAFVIPALFLFFIGNFAIKQWNDWNYIYETVYSRKSVVNELALWYNRQAPQGGRIVSEVIKMLHNYAEAPHTTHIHTVPSIFAEPVAAYRERGYDYLIWNDLKSQPADALADLDAQIPALEAQGAHEVLRLTSDQYNGPNVVVFQLDPLPEHDVYAWFTPAISFRGYDLNQETFKPGDTVALTLYWESADIVSNNYIVFVHLLDSQTGQLLAGQDGPPDNGLTPTWKWQGDMQFIRDQRELTIPTDAQPGTYILRIGMYDADTKARVTVLDLNEQPIGDLLVLQNLQVQN